MTDDRDPHIQALFAGAEEELADEAFTAAVMARAAVLGRRATLWRVVLATAVIFVALLFAGPLQDAVALSVSLLAHPLVAVSDATLGQLTLPVNNVAFPLALALLALRAIRRRLFS